MRKVAGVLFAKDVRGPAKDGPAWLRVATGGAAHGYGLVLREAGVFAPVWAGVLAAVEPAPAVARGALHP